MCCIQSFAETAVNFIQGLKLNLKKFIKYMFLEHLKQKYVLETLPPHLRNPCDMICGE